MAAIAPIGACNCSILGRQLEQSDLTKPKKAVSKVTGGFV